VRDEIQDIRNKKEGRVIFENEKSKDDFLFSNYKERLNLPGFGTDTAKNDISSASNLAGFLKI
jgi:hypothetical protein